MLCQPQPQTTAVQYSNSVKLAAMVIVLFHEVDGHFLRPQLRVSRIFGVPPQHKPNPSCIHLPRKVAELATYNIISGHKLGPLYSIERA